MLSMNPRKACLVQSLLIRCKGYEADESEGETRLALASLRKALEQMQALSDLRIRLPHRAEKYKTIQEQINDALRSVVRKPLHLFNLILTKPFRSNRFQLHTLYTNHSQDVPWIIKQQPQLRFLGMYNYHDLTTHRLWDFLRRVHVESSGSHVVSTLPLAFGLEQDTYLPMFNCLSIFPTFYPGRSTICGPITSSFDRPVTHGLPTMAESVSEVNIYLIDFSDLAYFRKIIEDMVSYLPQVSSLNLYIEHLTSQIVSHPFEFSFL
jgi:hypothetical protein